MNRVGGKEIDFFKLHALAKMHSDSRSIYLAIHIF